MAKQHARIIKRPAAARCAGVRTIKRPAAAVQRAGRYKKKTAEQHRQYAIARARKKIATDPNYKPKSDYLKRLVAVEQESKETNTVATQAAANSEIAMHDAAVAKRDAKRALLEVRKTHDALGSWFD